MQETKELTRIIWALDPLSPDLDFQKTTASVLHAMHLGKVEIIPVSVLTPAHVIENHQSYLSLLEDISQVTQKRLDDWHASQNFPLLAKPQIITEPRFSINKSVERLLEFASNEGAQMIALGTHARKGVQRFLLGSFAETLLLKSRLPLLIVNPTTQPPNQMRKILFATDLSQAASLTLDPVIELANQLGAHITVFNQIEYLNEYTRTTIAAEPLFEKYIKDDLPKREEKLNALVQRATIAGCSASYVIGERGAFASKEILTQAEREQSDLIALTAQSGKFASAILGSVSRQVVRESRIPVWLLHA